MCTATSSVIPTGVFPIGFHTGATNVGGVTLEHARYWGRFSFPNVGRRIEVEIIEYAISGMGCTVLLGAPFLAFVGLHLDPVKGEEYIWVHGNET